MIKINKYIFYTDNSYRNERDALAGREEEEEEKKTINESEYYYKQRACATSSTPTGGK